LVTDEAVRKERKPGIIEGRDGVIKTVVKGCSDGKVMGKSDKKKKSAQNFINESEPENRFQDYKKISCRGVKKGCLNDLSSFEGDPPSHEDEKDR
jgi:hypothetical protein